MKKIVSMLCLCFCIGTLYAQNIVTVAGGGSDYPGDGGPASAAYLYLMGVTVDGGGNVFIADNNGRVRKVSSAGVITTIAGTGSMGYSGDGGQATAAQLRSPYDLALDSVGNLYIADQSGATIRKVSPSGIISTVAGTGTSGFGGDGGAATAAQLNYPTSIALDRSGNLYVADLNNNRVRKVTPSGIISTIAGISSSGAFGGDGGQATAAQLWAPSGVAVDSAGNIYISDYGNVRIRKIFTSGIITTIAGTGTQGFSGDGGMATSAQFYHPTDLLVGIDGNIYVSDQRNCRIRKITQSGIVSSIAGTGAATYGGDGGAATAAQLYYPAGIAQDNYGNFYIADVNNNRLRKIITCPAPVVGAITGASVVYTGSNISLSDSIGGGSWNSSNISIASVSSAGVVTGVAVGSATITYSVTNSCGSAYATRAVTVLSSSNHSPAFSYIAPSNTVSLCQDQVAYPVSGLLQVRDADAGQTLTWSLATAPVHGSASVAYVTTSTGGIVRPVGVTYTPAAGYTGSDSMRVTISDGIVSVTSTFRIVINPKPSAPVISGPTTVCYGNTITLTGTPAGGLFGSMDGNTSTNPTAGIVRGTGGGASVIYYNSPNNAFGCRTQSRHTVTVLGIPSAGTISGVATVCPGASVTFSPGVSSGVWSCSDLTIASVSDGGVVAGLSSGSAYVSYTVNNGCNSATVRKPLVVSGATLLGSITGLSSVFAGSALALTNSRSGGTWSSSNLSVATVHPSTGIVTGVAAGNDTIFYSYTNSCGITASVFRRISVLARRDDNATSNSGYNYTPIKLEVSPNPVSGIVMIVLDGVSGNMDIMVSDVAGKVVYAENNSTTKSNLDLSFLSPGVYIIRASNFGSIYTEKIVVE